MTKQQTAMQRPESESKNILIRMATFLFLLMIGAMPWKMASMVQVQEMPMDYWFSPYEIIFMQWPIPVFAVLSGLLLLLTLGGGCGSLLIRGGKENQWQIAYVLLWCFTALVSFLGIVQASCLEYADQMIYYNFGICSFTVAAVMLVQQEKRMIRWIAVAMFCGMILSLISGLHQHFIAFDELEQYLKEQSRLTGTDLLAGKMGISLQERRLTADFGICNIYGGFLMAMLPLAAVMVWRFSRQVKPQNVSRFVLTIPFLLIALFVIVKTGSRGAWFALLAGGFVACMLLPVKIKYRGMALGAALLGAAGFVVMVLLGRGFLSMRFRLDYFYAAFRMMLEHPLTGSGWGDFFHDYLQLKLLYNNEAPHTPHNMFLLFGSQTGIVGLLLLLGAVLLPLIAGILLMRDQFKSNMTDLGKSMREQEQKKWICFAVFVSFMIFWVDSMLEISFECPAFITYFNLTGIMLLAIRQRQKLDNVSDNGNSGAETAETTETVVKKQAFRLPATAFVLLMAAIGLFTLYRGYAMGVREYRYCQLQNQISGQGNTDLMQSRPTVEQISRSLEKTVSVGQYSPFPYAEAARFFIAIKEYSLAEKCISKAIELSPLRPGFYLTRAKLHYWMSNNDPRAARQDLEKIRELSPRNPEYFVSDTEILTGIRETEND